MLFVPLLERVSKLSAKTAHATAVATMACLSVVSLSIYLYSGSIDFNYAVSISVGGAAGGALGAVWLTHVPTWLLRTGFALFMIFAAWRFFIG